MTTLPTNVNVTAPVGLAIERVKRALFQPFNLSKWFIIGFSAWLAHLGEGGFRGGFNYNFSNRGDRGGRLQFEHIKDYVVSNLNWIVPLAVVIGIVCLALWVLFTWLSSRGHFMFLHCVALDKAEIEAPWRKFAREGNSLFVFRLVLGLVAIIPVLPLMGLMGISVYRMIDHGGPSVGGVAGAIVIGLALAAVGIAFAIIAKFTTDFVVPIMFLRGGTCRDGWKELLGLLSANVGNFILYLLFQIVLGIATGIIVLIVVVATCCIAGCLLAIPYIGTVLLLPILMFGRCYSLYYLAQYGTEYHVFPPPAPTVPGTPPSPDSTPPLAPG